DDAGAGGGAHRRGVGKLEAALAEEGPGPSGRSGIGRGNYTVDFAGRWACGLTSVAPQGAGIDENGAAEAAVLWQEIERILHFEAGAPVHGAAERVVARARSDIARPDAGGLESAHQIGLLFEVVEQTHVVIVRNAGIRRRAVLKTEHISGLQVQHAHQIGDDFVVGANVHGGPQIGYGAADTRKILTKTDIDTAGRQLVVIERVVDELIADN